MNKKKILFFVMVICFICLGSLNLPEIKPYNQLSEQNNKENIYITYLNTEASTPNETEPALPEPFDNIQELSFEKIEINNITEESIMSCESETTSDKPVPSVNPLFDGDISRFKCYMSYKTITNKKSKQWELQQQAYTDENGLRKINDYYLVATGSYWAEYKCGNKYVVTLETGTEFKIIIGDMNIDSACDPERKYFILNGCVLEFIVDIKKLPAKIKLTGDISYLKEFEGKIIKMEIEKEN